MDAIIKTGFQSVNHNIAFQPQTLTKGKSLVSAGHVRDVEEHRRLHQSYLIKSRIIRQTSVHTTPYSTSLKINAERCVTEVSCDCVYNQSKKCKHVAALLYYINNEASVSKTSEEQRWGKPSARQFAKSKYSKGADFEKITPCKYQHLDDSEQTDVSELLSNSSLRKIMVAQTRNTSIHTVKSVMNSLITQVEINLEQEDCAECINTFLILLEEHAAYKSCYELDSHVREFYLKNIALSEDSIVSLGCETLQQSNCDNDKWYQARRTRLSASTNVHSIKIRLTKSIDSLVSEILKPKKISCSSTKYGLKFESHAREKYELLYGCVVKRVGVVVHKYQPWLCASLDGVVIHDGCISKLIEIKCPASCEKKAVINIVEKTCNVKYLTFVDGKVVLKRSSAYYTQIQMQMYVTGMTVCDLFVYSPVFNGCCLVEVLRDEEFLKEVIPKSEKFYFKHYLPAVYEEATAQTNDNNNNNGNMTENGAIHTFNNNNTKNNCNEQMPKRSFTGQDIRNTAN